MMKKLFTSLILTFSFLFFFSSSAYALPAFPGAQGFGSTTPGGRGGTVYLVTNLNNSGAGSLRACAEASGPRICIFRTGGTINLTSVIYIKNPYLTIAGQTAPGEGILIKGPYAPGSYNEGPEIIRIGTHDVIIRGLRLREVNRAAIHILAVPKTSTQTHHIVIDHNSMSWSTDTILDTWYAVNNITISWNILSEPVGLSSTPGDHNFGMLIGGFDDCTTPGSGFTIHHNIFAHSGDRNPRILHGVNSTEVVNNLVYNWYWFGTRTGSEAAIVGNQYITGSNTVSSKPIYAVNESCQPLQAGDIFVSHNIGPGRTTDTGDDWNIVSGGTAYRANSWPFQSSGVSVEDVSTLQAKLFEGTGAIVPKRDAVDARIINEIKNKTGGFMNSASSLVWPVLSNGTPPSDSDGDGLPDSWDATGRDPSDIAPSGYTWIEEYINSFYSSQPPAVSPSPSPVNKAGDLNNDGHVNLADYNLLVAGFGTKYTLSDYNQLVANFGT